MWALGDAVLILATVAAAYFTYYWSQRYGARPYPWLVLGMLLPMLGPWFVLLRFQNEPVTAERPTLAPPGFRSGAPWKMALGTVAYSMWLLVLVVALKGGDVSSTLVTP